MKKHIISVVTLVAIVGVMALLLAGTNAITAPIIEKNAGAAANAALLEVMPEGENFEAVDLSTFELPATVTEAHKETSGKGYVVKLTTKGYGADFVIMCGVSADGVVTGAVCLSSNETLGKEKEYGQNFTGKDAAAVEATDTISGATMTTSAYKGAVKDALNTAIILGGGSADLRTEEEILADNLAAALPEGDTFHKWFATVEIDGVDAVYVADNGKGYVCIATAEEIGEDFTGEFIGIDADGKIVSAGSTKNTAAAVDAVTKIKAVDSTHDEEVDLTAYPDIHQNVTEISKINNGNYILTINAAGYGIKGGDQWHPASGEYIVVKLCITPEGKILACKTMSQAESENIGDACAKDEFTNQFAGKTADTLTEVEAISGATITTNGYMEAVQRALDAVKILEGGAK
ncbi:MAG: FMN-binding protein [Clostridia bacterium]|nr:FMN-binding protein [Clostridia bacterium]